jgi:predicted phage terminase large subunit-like protein
MDSAAAAALDPEREEALRLYRELVDDWEPLETFIRRIAPHQAPPPHLVKLIEVMERARTEEVQVCISMPPRHGKSITLHRAIVWWLRHAPADTLAYYAYNNDFAEYQSRKARAIAATAGLVLANSNLSEWVTPLGGGLILGGVGTGLVGMGVNGFFVVDDPVKDRAQAQSPTIRENVWDWFNEVVFTRLENASVIVVHTRWHEDDLIGRLTTRLNWEYINFPAFAEPGDPLGRKEGEALWPARRGTKKLEGIRRQMGDWAFEAQFQGRPRPRGAAVFGPARRYNPKTVDLTGCIGIIGGDPAASERTQADYSAAVALAIRFGKPTLDPVTKQMVTPDPVAYVIGVYRKQVTVPAFARALRDFQKMHWHAPIAVEAVGGFAAVPQLLREQAPGINLTEIHPITDKFLRAQSFAAAWNDGRVLVPEDAPWVEEFINELQRFTGLKDAHDDQVDAAAHAWNTAVGGEPAPMRAAVKAVDRWR